eukprot:tig00020538_g10361.t1
MWAQITGVVSVLWPDDHTPTAHECTIFEALCDQIGQLIGQDNLHRALERRLQSEALLRHIAKGMRTNHPLPEVMVESVGGIRTLFKATAVLVEVDIREPPMQFFAKRGLPTSKVLEDDQVARTPPAVLYRFERLRADAGRIHVIPDFLRYSELDEGGPASSENDPEFEALRQWMRQMGFLSGLARGTKWGGKACPLAPDRDTFFAKLLIALQPTGVVFIGWDTAREPSQHTLTMLDAVGEQIADATGQDGLMRALEAEIRSREQQLAREQLLRSITSQIRDTLEPRTIMEKASRVLRKAFDAWHVCIYKVEWEPVARRSGFKNGHERSRVIESVCAKAATANEQESPDFVIEADVGEIASSATVQRRLEAIIATKGLHTIQMADILRAQEWAGETPGPDGLVDAATVQLLRESGCRSGLARATSWGGRVNGVVGPKRALMVDLVGEVLDASILERGGSLRVSAVPMDLRSAAEEVMDMMWPVAAQKNIALQLRMGAGVPRFIFSDKGRIRQVIINLVGNSAKFSTDGRIIVELEAEGCPGPDGKYLFRIMVTDTGCGIPEGSQAKLFRFFTQLDSSKSRRHQGTGLGLFISLHIALALEGSIDFVSTVGSGSTFAFTFRASVVPQGDRALPALQDLCPPKEDPLIKGKTLIVGVDDLAWEGTIAVDAASWGVRVCLERTVEGTLGAVRREAAEGRGAQLAGAVFFMPSLVPPAELPAVVERLLEELRRAQGAAERAPPPLILLRIGVRIEKALILDNVISLRLSVSERMLYKTLTDGVRARTEEAGTGQAQPPQRSSTPPYSIATRSNNLFAATAPELEHGSDPAAAPRPEPPAEGGPKRPIRILFSEDTPTNAKIVTMLLRKLGYSDVEHAEDGARALQAAKAAAAAGRPFDVLLSDIMMPEMDGLESLRRMRAELPAGRVPYAVALSANVGAHDRQECAEAGYDAFLAKPVRTKELSEALKAAEEAVATRRAAGRPAGGADLELGSAGMRLDSPREESAKPSAAAALPTPASLSASSQDPLGSQSGREE